MKKVKFDIQGMTCSSCSSHVEKAVAKLEGVSNLSVNLISNNMTLEYDEQILSIEKIIKAVEGAGYGATLADENRKRNNKSSKNVDNKSAIKSMKKRLIASICFLIPLLYIAMHKMIYGVLGLQIPAFMQNNFEGIENSINFAFTQLLFVIPIIYLNRNYFSTGFKRIIKGSPNMDSLISLGSGAATLYGIFSIYMIGYGLGHGRLDLVERYSSDIYFESAGTILTLITFGKYLEAKSKDRTSDAISKLINLSPKVATVIREDKESEIEVEDIIVGDVVVIKPGSTIPIDGTVIEGKSSVNQANITGESIPIPKEKGDMVISGTVNKNGYLKIRANKVGNDTTLSQIIKLVEEASNSKAPISKLADKVSGVFVPIVIIIAILATCFWLYSGQSFEFALSIGIAVLVISCPCALGLATPVAIMVGMGKGAEKGILFKSAEGLELLHLVDTVVFDKTGTITQGKPVVTDIVSKIEENKLLTIAGSLEKNSEHPLADAVLEKAYKKCVAIFTPNEFSYISGRGISGFVDGKKYYIGNSLFLKENNIEPNDISQKAEEMLKKGKTVLYIADENELLGIIAVSDPIKENAEIAIRELKRQNIEVIMLTGDNENVAEAIAKEIGIKKVIAEVLPIDKENEILKLQEKGKKVAFVGDGVNDSPALVRADVGIAIGSGTDIAIESADVVLLKDNLVDSVTAIRLSKAVINNIKMNLFWAFFYNSVGIPIAAGVFYNAFGLKLNPMIGAAAMSLSSLCVVTNALRLKRFKTNFEVENIKEEEINMNEIVKEVIIDGMQCNHCKMTVEKVLGAIEGVISVEVNLENKSAIVKANTIIENAKIKEVIDEAGFCVVEIK